MYKEDIDISQVIKQEISQVIDQWVNDLIKDKVATTQISPTRQRGLWDRLKGTLSNIWHGRYNQQNPNYWKNRFGDDLGAQEESFDPRVFSLSEYKDLKLVIEETESLVIENISPEVEKLRIVRIIRSAAEELKQKLYSIFVKSCSSGDVGQAAPQASEQPNRSDDDGGPSVAPVDTNKSKDTTNAADTTDETQPPSQGADPVADAGSTNDIPTNDPPSDPILPDRVYLKSMPKSLSHNKGTSVQELLRKDQFIDAILHDDYKHHMLQHLVHKEKTLWRLDALLHDAKIKGAKSRDIEKIEEAKAKFLSLSEDKDS